MTNFIKPEYLISLYFSLNDKEIVTLEELGNYCGKLNNALKEKNIEAVFLFSSNYIDEMLNQYNYFEEVTYLESLKAIKRKVSNELLSEQFMGYISNDVLKVVSELQHKEKRMTTEDKCKIMKAYCEGKEIQSKAVIGEHWCDDTNPNWDWNHFEYRIKPESKYRPYKNLEEFKKDIVRKYGGSKFEHIIETRNIWLKSKYTEHIGQIIYFTTDNLFVDGDYYTWKTLFANYTYLDGTPFGIEG